LQRYLKMLAAPAVGDELFKKATLVEECRWVMTLL
jgi:hypothetical protein